jgi:S-adenosylmethionine hydrolase
MLNTAYRYFPRGTVHLVVVDPGVGGERRPILLARGEHYFVGPDNGVFTRLLEGAAEFEAHEIRESRFLLPGISDTFHGRDLFAPVAAYVARGVEPAEFGPKVADPCRLPVPEPRIWGDQIRGEVIHVDSFGNIVSNITREQFEGAVGSRPFKILINGKAIDRLHRTYSDQERGRVLALFGSSDLLEIAVCQGRAERRIGAGKGDIVLVQIEEKAGG